MTPLPPSPFIDPDRRFVLDVAAFDSAMWDMPAFIAAPRPEYLKACDLMPMLAVLAGH